MSNALKAVDRTDDHLIVENHIILFGGRDLEGQVNENVNPDGTTGEFFTKNTDLRSTYTNTGVLYVDWDHGHGDDGEPKADDILGYVDWTTAKADDEGVIVRRILDRRSRFIQLIEPLIDEGLVGTSSESLARGVEKADTGEILRWPLVRDTLTVTPMEPRMLSANALQAAKALVNECPAYKSVLLKAEEPEPEQITNQPEPTTEPVSVEINEQETDKPAVVQNVAQEPEPETAAEPDETEEQMFELLGQFMENVTQIIGARYGLQHG